MSLRKGDGASYFANVVGTVAGAPGAADTSYFVRLPPDMPQNTTEAFDAYLTSFGEKAFAVSKDHQRTGRSWNGKSIEEARSIALKYCGTDCKVYAIGNFVFDPSPNLRLPDGMSQEMTDNFTQYVDAPDEKAFAIGSDGILFGWIEQSKSITDAKAQAMKLCGKSCHLYAVGNVLVK
jgi:hypothetical protein